MIFQYDFFVQNSELIDNRGLLYVVRVTKLLMVPAQRPHQAVLRPPPLRLRDVRAEAQGEREKHV